ncbi:sodium:solute symporter family protein [Naumannella huperziae]
MIIMMSMLVVFYAIVIFILYRTKQTDNPTFSEYSVGGRRYGPWFVAMCYVNSWWPGATYIAFFGLAAGAGVFGFYGLAYSTLGVAMMYFLATRAWRWGAHYNLRSQPELMGLRYNSSAVRIVASLIGVISVFPWVVLGMQALGEVFVWASAGTIPLTACLIIGLVAILIRQYWTVRMGMRGLIMTDAFQGCVAYVGAAVVCLVLLSGLAGPPVGFAELGRLPVEFLRVPGDGDGYGPLYLASLIFTGVVGSLCWPMSFQRIYTASGVRSVKAGTIRTVLISATFYTLLMVFGIAVSQMPVVAENPQAGWFTALQSYGGTWLLGLGVTIVFAASMGHIDGSVQVCGLQIANDLVNSERRQLTDVQLTRVAKISMVIFMLLAGVLAYLTFNFSRLQLLAQISYQGIIQLAVPLFIGVFWQRGSKQGAIAGMVTGFSVAAVLTAIYPDDMPALASITGGIVGLGVNLLVFAVVSALTPPSAAERQRVAEMFDVARNPVRVAPVPMEVSELTEPEGSR